MHHFDPLHPLHHGPVQHSILHHGILHHKVALAVAAVLIIVGISALAAAPAFRTKPAGPVPASMSTWMLHMTTSLTDMPTTRVDEPY